MAQSLQAEQQVQHEEALDEEHFGPMLIGRLEVSACNVYHYHYHASQLKYKNLYLRFRVMVSVLQMSRSWEMLDITQ